MKVKDAKRELAGGTGNSLKSCSLFSSLLRSLSAHFQENRKICTRKKKFSNAKSNPLNFLRTFRRLPENEKFVARSRKTKILTAGIY